MCHEVSVFGGVQESFDADSQIELSEDMTSSSLGDDLERELNGFVTNCPEYSLSCRVKVYFLGDTNAGKTSLVQSLTTNGACLAKKATEAVNHVTWRPFKDNTNDKLLDRMPSVDERNLSMGLWDMTGRKTCQGLHQLFFTHSIFVLVFNLDDSTSSQHLPKHINAVQTRVPGSPILLVGTRADNFFTEDDRKKKAEETFAGVRAALCSEVEAIKHDITQISDIGADPKLLARIEWLESLLERRPKIHPSIFPISCKTGKGLNRLRRALVNMAMDLKLFPHTNQIVKPEIIRISEKIQSENLKGSLLITMEEYRKIIQDSIGSIQNNSPIGPAKDVNQLVDETILPCSTFLENLGALRVFPTFGESLERQKSIKYVCTCPHQLARLLCLCHVDDHRKAFKISAKRFWPNSSTRPDPGALVKMLEEIPHHGVVRDVLFPLLFQEKSLPENQIKRILDLLKAMGILVWYPSTPTDPHAAQEPSPPTNVISIPNYTELSHTSKHHVVLMNLTPDCRPHLNWSPRPLKGDIQLNWRFSFPVATPPGLTHRMLGVFHTATRPLVYTHHWRYGLLIKLQDAIICMEVDTVDLYVDVMCRVNAEDQESQVEAAEFMWAHLAPYVTAVLAYLKRWPGLVFKNELVPYGACFYDDVAVEGEHPSFPLAQCLVAAKNNTSIKFTDGGVECSFNAPQLMVFDVADYLSVEDWLSHILEERERVLASSSYTPLPPTIYCSQQSFSERRASVKRSKSKHDVKWDMTNFDTEQNKRSESVDNGTPKVVSRSNSPTVIPERKESVFEKPISGKGIMIGEEQMTKDAERVASGFVAAILAQAVADYVESVHEDNHQEHTLVTRAQVNAAKYTADAAVAAQTGEIEAAARAVMEAVKALEERKYTNHGVKSKTCLIL